MPRSCEELPRFESDGGKDERASPSPSGGRMDTDPGLVGAARASRSLELLDLDRVDHGVGLLAEVVALGDFLDPGDLALLE